jgi:hypothetical protein
MGEWCGVSRTHDLLFQTYRHLDMHGEIVEIIEQGANEHINALSKKCLGKDHEPSRPKVRGPVSSRQSLFKRSINTL